MLISRGLHIVKALHRSGQFKNAATKLQPFRSSSHGGWYRTTGDPDKLHIIGAEIYGGILWWWVLWHLWHDYEHITGEWPYPDVSAWTDAELGIPPEED